MSDAAGLRNHLIALGEKPRILITRLSAIGDCVHSVPLVHALRDRFPDAHIAWATQNAAASLLSGLGGLDEVLVVRKDWLKSVAEIRRIRRELLCRQFDVALDIQSLTKSSAIAWLSGAKHRIGFAAPQGRELSLLLNNVRQPPQANHVVDRYLELLQPLGIHKPRVCFELPRYPDARRQVDAWLQPWLQQQPDDRRSFAVINPGAGWGSKVWPAERYTRVAQHLYQRHGVPSVVVWAGPEEHQWAQTIQRESDGSAWLAPQTSLPDLVELLRQCRLFVGSDTGPLHMAAAVNIPCVALFGPTSPERCGPYGSQHQVVTSPVRCEETSMRKAMDVMEGISTEAACAACDRLCESFGQDQAAA
ncbi:MAG: glycosyltransferase family 9 protein [Planctomycetales bacterium]|nr:glycosyltransferase family 9 protein [Planctomycetales bacterium]